MLRNIFKTACGLFFVIMMTHSSICQAEDSFFDPIYTPEKIVSIYMAEWCPHCVKAKEYLSSLGIEYNVYDIETPEGQDKYSKLDMAQGVPVITVGQFRMDGFSAQQLDMMLCDSGVLMNCEQNS